MNSNSKIYVAGHLGLVGSAITKVLRKKGYTNIIGRSIDDLDLMDTRAVNAFFELEKPEYIVLAAAKVGGIVANNTYRGQFIYENLMIQNNVIHAAYMNRVKKLLFLGSTCIYPREAHQPMQEDCLLTSPLEYTNEPYAIAKIAGIKMCESYNIQYDTNFISVMPTNLYGPNDNFNLETSHVLPALLRKIHLGKCLQNGNWDTIRKDLERRPVDGVGRQEPDSAGQLTRDAIVAVLRKYGITFSSDGVVVSIWGTGRPMREFLWSEEMAEASVYCLENVDFKQLKGNNFEIRNTHINIGTGKEITIRDLAILLKETVEFKGEIVFDTSKPDGTIRKLTDPSKIHRLGWHHRIEIDEGVQKLYNWYLEDLRITTDGL